MTKIKIFLNGEERLLESKTSLAELILELGLDVKKIAIEKDLEIVNSSQYLEVILDEGSRIEIVHFIGGG